MTVGLSETWREAAKEARPKWSGGPHCKCDACAVVCADAAVRVVLEHLQSIEWGDDLDREIEALLEVVR